MAASGGGPAQQLRDEMQTISATEMLSSITHCHIGVAALQVVSRLCLAQAEANVMLQQIDHAATAFRALAGSFSSGFEWILVCKVRHWHRQTLHMCLCIDGGLCLAQKRPRRTEALPGQRSNGACH